MEYQNAMTSNQYPQESYPQAAMANPPGYPSKENQMAIVNIQPPPPPPGYPPEAVICPNFCAPYLIDLKIVRKLITVRGGHFCVLDVNGNVVFQIKRNFFSIRECQILSDAGGNPIVSLQRKIFTMHKRWKVFRGDSSDPKDLIFTTRLSHLIHRKTELDVYLAGNPKETSCDYKIKGSLLQRSCTIYAGSSTNESNVIARMRKKFTAQNIVLGKNEYGVTVNPHVDSAFVVALVAILNEIEHGEQE